MGEYRGVIDVPGPRDQGVPVHEGAGPESLVAIPGAVLVVTRYHGIFRIELPSFELTQLCGTTMDTQWSGALAQDGGRVLVGGTHETVFGVDLATGAVAPFASGHSSTVDTVVAPPNSDETFTLERNGWLNVWVGGRRIRRHHIAETPVRAFAVNQTGEVFALECERQIQFRSALDGSVLGTWETNGDGSPILFDKDGSLLCFDRGQLMRLRLGGR